MESALELDEQQGSNPRAGEQGKLVDVFAAARQAGASDIHLQAGAVPSFRVGGQIQSAEFPAVEAHRLEQFADGLLGTQGRQRLAERGSVDGVYADGPYRFRFNLYRSQGTIAVALRALASEFKELEELGLPQRLSELCDFPSGLVLVAGPTGSGKTTTLATLVHHINRNFARHIVTIEEPVEFVHDNLLSLVHQRQVGLDTPDFHQALVDAVRQDPDVILVGEIRDLDTIRTAITAAETGHLVFATVHASNTVAAIDRLISVFPGDEQATIRHLLSTSLRAVVAQQLVRPARSAQAAGTSVDPDNGSRRVLVSEVLKVNHAVSNLISTSQLKQIRSLMETGAGEGMYTLDMCLARLSKRRRIDSQTAEALAHNPRLLPELMRTV